MPTNTNSSVTSQWLPQATKQLTKAGIGNARLDCLVLLEDVVYKDRSWLLAHPEYELTAAQISRLQQLIKRRATHEPLAYLRGKTEFYGREFSIDKRVLEPRPESETMIDLLKSVIPQTDATIVDVGTGSGALGTTAALELPESNVLATDIDPACLQVALQNAKKRNASVQFFKGDLLEPVGSLIKAPCLLLANLPYVPDSHTVNEAAMREPKLAIFGGPDGLDLYRRLFQQITQLSLKPRYVLTESLPFQHQQLAEIAKVAGYKQIKADDFIQLFQI